MRSLCISCIFLCLFLLGGCASSPIKKLASAKLTQMQWFLGGKELYTTSDEYSMRDILELLTCQNWRSHLPTTEPANLQDRVDIHLFAGEDKIGTIKFYDNTPRFMLVLSFSIRSYEATLSEADTALLKQKFIHFPPIKLEFSSIINPASTSNTPSNSPAQ